MGAEFRNSQAMTADVAIIGAGIIGSSAALELSRRGLDVLVVDKAGGPGMGSTSASSAVIRFNYSTFAGVAVSWESKFRWEAWEEHLGYRDPNGLARFHRCGKILLDVPVLSRRKMTALFDRAGIPYEEWDSETLAARVPGIDTGAFYPPKRVDSEEFFDDPHGRLGAIFTPDGGYVDDPRLAAANLAAAAAHRGARSAYRRLVTSISRAGQVWRVEIQGNERVEAPVLLNAAGPWSSSVNAMVGATADFTIEIAPLRQKVHQVPAPAPLQGTYRIGDDGGAQSVCDSHAQLWGLDNLFLGGNGTIPAATACNPTLTSVAIAARSVRRVLEVLG